MRASRISPDVRGQLIDLARKMGVGLVATNDVHFLNADDYEAHNALCCISTGKKITDPDADEVSAGCVSEEPRRDAGACLPMCPRPATRRWRSPSGAMWTLDLKSRHAPVYMPPDGSTPEDFLQRAVRMRGLKRRYGKVTRRRSSSGCERELEVIEGKGFASYFLIVWDFCNYAWQNQYPGGRQGQRGGDGGGVLPGDLRCGSDPV